MAGFTRTTEPAERRAAVVPRIAAILSLCASPVPAMAQTASQATLNDDREIIVEGRAETADERRERAQQFVRQMGVAKGQRPVARWIDPVCPKVTGLSEAHAGIVQRRLRAVAVAAAVPFDSGPCRTNVIVSFVDRGGDMVRRLMRRAGSRFRDVPLAERDALRSDSIPARWWYTTEMRDRDGRRASGMALPWTGPAEGGVAAVPDVGGGTFSHYGSSIVSTQMIRALTSATIVIDANLATGVPLDAVAAHSALVAFAEIAQGQAPPADSILALYQPGVPPLQLSAWDRAFLQDLYAMPFDRRARQQRGRLVARLAAE